MNGAAAAIATAMKAAWAERSVLIMEGEVRNPPQGARWARMSILWGDGDELTMGDDDVGENVIAGLVVVQLFALPGAGTGELEEDADVVRGCFNRADIGNARFGVPSGPARAEEREGWMQMNVSAPFQLEETI